MAFLATLDHTAGGAGDNQGAYISKAGTLLKIARRGQGAPDGNGSLLDLKASNAPSGTTIGLDNVAINEVGQVAFRATLTGTAGGTASEGIFRGDGATLTQIVRLGDIAPDGVSRIRSLGVFALNDEGQVAFVAGVVKGASTSDAGIFLWDDARGLVQVIRTGDPLLGSRIRVSSPPVLQSSTTTNGKLRSGLNGHGQVVFRFDLDDGRRGVAVASTSSDGTTTTTLVTTGSSSTTTTTSVATSTTTTTAPCTSARCTLDAIQTSAVCAGQAIPGAVTKNLNRAKALIEQAAPSPAKQARRLLKRARKALKQAGTKAIRAAKGTRPKISSGCASALHDAIGSVVGELGV